MKTKATLHNLKTIPVIPIDLALSPHERWQEVPNSVLKAAGNLAKKQTAMVPTGTSIFLRAATKFGSPYRDDIDAWAELLGADIGDLLIGTFSYELSMAGHV